jgi:hypothetical protein
MAHSQECGGRLRETFLTDEELRYITGRSRYRAQVRALGRMGIGYIVRPDGRPIVTREALEVSVGGYKRDRAVEPDFSSLMNGAS